MPKAKADNIAFLRLLAVMAEALAETIEATTDGGIARDGDLEIGVDTGMTESGVAYYERSRRLDRARIRISGDLSFDISGDSCAALSRLIERKAQR